MALKKNAEAGVSPETAPASGPEEKGAAKPGRPRGRPPGRASGLSRGRGRPRVSDAQRMAEKNAAFRMQPEQVARMTELLQRESPRWTRTQWLECFMATHQQLERVVATLPGLDEFAVQAHLTVPEHRRKGSDWEWMLDALALLAAERLEQLGLLRKDLLPEPQSKGKPPAGQ